MALSVLPISLTASFTVVGAKDDQVIKTSIRSALSSPFLKAKELYLKAQVAEAYKALESQKDDALSAEQRELKYYTMAQWANELGRRPLVDENLNKAKSYGSLFSAYENFLSADLALQQQKYDQAYLLFNKVIESKPPRNIIYESRFGLSTIALQKKQWSTAYPHLRYLEKRWRGDDRHPDILWRLVKVENERGHKSRMCYWARKIYRSYPTHPLIYDWGPKLAENQFEGKRTGCKAHANDLEKRIRWFQLAGQPELADREIKNLIAEATTENERIERDMLLAEFYIDGGYLENAIKILLKHDKVKANDIDYLNKFAKATAKAGEYQTAVGLYIKAHGLKENHTQGRRALFSAAFLSYQFQDYDGATRRFNEFINKHPHSGLSRDAKWYLAWIHYLKGDYDGAIARFNGVLKEKRKYRRRWQKYSEEKLTYWLGMAYYRKKQFDKAEEFFKQLIMDKSTGYYTLAAQYRYNLLPGVEPIRELASITPKSVSSTVEKIEEKADENLMTLQPPAIGLPEVEKTVSTEEEESEDILAADDSLEVEEIAEEEEVESEPPEVISLLSDPKLKVYFERAHHFISIGLYEWAKWELYSVELKTRNPDYLKLLMSAYEKMNFYHRSSYVGQIYFGQQMKNYGMQGVRPLWEFTFPKAFPEIVEKFARQFHVQEEFIWSIMRAESNYREDITSPVGAKGLMQVMPYTGERVAKLLGDHAFHARQLVHPETNIRLGSRYLQRLLKKFEGSLPLATAAYNAGPHRVEGWLSRFGQMDTDEFIEHIPFVETRNYVKRVMRHYGVYQSLYNETGAKLPFLAQQVPIRISYRPPTREMWDDIE